MGQKPNKLEHLERSFLILATCGVVVVSLVIGLATAIPFFRQLKSDNELALVDLADTKAALVESYLHHITAIARQMSVRRHARELLADYLAGKLPLAGVRIFTERLFQDLLEISPEITGMQRLDRRGRVIAELGQRPPQDLRQKLGQLQGSSPQIHGPIVVGAGIFWMVSTPVQAPHSSATIGTDLLLFPCTKLQEIVSQHSRQGTRNGEFILGQVQENTIRLFYPLRVSEPWFEDGARGSYDEFAIIQAKKTGKGILHYKNAEGRPMLLAYAHVDNTPWELTLRMDPREFYQPLYRQLAFAVAMILVLIAVGAFLTHRLLSPFAGQILLHSDELENTIRDATSLLETELTERKKVEESLIQVCAERDRFFNVCVDMLCTANLDGYFEFLNPAWTDTLGYSLEEIRVRPYLDLVHPDDRVRTMEAAATLSRGAHMKHFQNRYLHKDGRYRWLDWCAIGIVEEKRLFGIARDVTEQKKAQVSLEQLNASLERRVAERTAELETSNAELEQFAYVASHDLREPLRMVTSYCQLLQQSLGNQATPEQTEFVRFAISGALRMKDVTDDLLELSRVGTTKKPFVQVNCSTLVGNVLQSLQIAIQEKHASVECGTLPKIYGDESQLVQVFQNLIENALKFSGSQSPRVRIWAEYKGSTPVFSVQDNGIGIAPQYFDRIFVLFSRLHTREQYDGTGIGLALCKKIVERHGGKIWVESEPGNGTTFHFTLPEKGPASRIANA